MKEIELTEDEETHLTILLNIRLRGAEEFTKNYADIMNSIWHKLTGKNHGEWLRRPENKESN